MEIITRPPAALAAWFVADLAREIRASMSLPGRTAPFTLAVPGGSVAEAFFPALAAAAVEWGGVTVFWADERAVPPESPDSNYALAERLWLGPAGVPGTSVHRMEAERPDVARAASEYAAALTAAAGSPPVLDYVLLGVGADGHVASVFPGDVPLRGEGPVGWTDASPKPPARRMTLTLETLARARRVVVAALDAGKRGAIDDALGDAGARSPLARLLRDATRPALLLAPEAAAR